MKFTRHPVYDFFSQSNENHKNSNIKPRFQLKLHKGRISGFTSFVVD